MTTEIYKEYATPDITLATVLKEHGCVLDRIVIQNKQGIFYFKDVEKEFLQQYDMGNTLVEPQSFHNALKSLTIAIKRQING